MRTRTSWPTLPVALLGAILFSCVAVAPARAANPKPYAGQTINVVYTTPAPPATALAQFTAQTGIRVQWVNLGYDELQTKITAASVAHSYFADVTDVDWSRVGQYYRLKWFTPLNGYINTAALKSDVPQLSSFIENGTLVGMPSDSSFTVTTVNVQDFQRAGIKTMPRTFADYNADLTRLQTTKVMANPLDIPFSAAEGLSTYWYQMTAAFGGTMLDKSFNPLFTSPQSAGYRALAWMVNAYKSGLTPKANINMADEEAMQGEMALGRVSTIFSDYAGQVDSIYNVHGSSHVIGQVQYIATPGVTGPAPNLGNPDGIGIPAGAHNPGAAAAFIQWFDDPTNQANWAGLSGSKGAIATFPLPMRLSSLQMLTRAGRLTQGALLVELLQHHAQAAFPNGIPPWYTQFSASVNTNIHGAALGAESPDDAIKAIAQTVNSLR